MGANAANFEVARLFDWEAAVGDGAVDNGDVLDVVVEGDPDLVRHEEILQVDVAAVRARRQRQQQSEVQVESDFG